jgi:hypothetical protein
MACGRLSFSQYSGAAGWQLGSLAPGRTTFGSASSACTATTMLPSGCSRTRGWLSSRVCDAHTSTAQRNNMSKPTRTPAHSSTMRQRHALHSVPWTSKSTHLHLGVRVDHHPQAARHVTRQAAGQLELSSSNKALRLLDDAGVQRARDPAVVVTRVIGGGTEVSSQTVLKAEPAGMRPEHTPQAHTHTHTRGADLEPTSRRTPCSSGCCSAPLGWLVPAWCWLWPSGASRLAVDSGPPWRPVTHAAHTSPMPAHARKCGHESSAAARAPQTQAQP